MSVYSCTSTSKKQQQFSLSIKQTQMKSSMVQRETMKEQDAHRAMATLPHLILKNSSCRNIRRTSGPYFTRGNKTFTFFNTHKVNNTSHFFAASNRLTQYGFGLRKRPRENYAMYYFTTGTAVRGKIVKGVQKNRMLDSAMAEAFLKWMSPKPMTRFSSSTTKDGSGVARNFKRGGGGIISTFYFGVFFRFFGRTNLKLI